MGNFSAVPHITPAIIAATVQGNKEAYSQSFKPVYLAAIAFGCCGIIAALNAPNSEAKFTNVVSRKLHGKSLDRKVARKDEAADQA